MSRLTTRFPTLLLSRRREAPRRTGRLRHCQAACASRQTLEHEHGAEADQIAHWSGRMRRLVVENNVQNRFGSIPKVGI
jgi:hypothetical protein